MLYGYCFHLQLPISAFVSRGNDYFIAGDPTRGYNFLGMVWAVNDKIVDSHSEVEMVTGLSVFWIIMHYSKGKVDPFVQVGYACKCVDSPVVRWFVCQ